MFLTVNYAWTSLDATEHNAIEKNGNRPQLIALLSQHIASGYPIASDLERVLSENGGAVTLITIGAAPLKLRRDGEAITLGKASNAPRIVGAPIIAGNDVIYCVDGIIPPPSRQ